MNEKRIRMWIDVLRALMEKPYKKVLKSLCELKESEYDAHEGAVHEYVKTAYEYLQDKDNRDGLASWAILLDGFRLVILQESFNHDGTKNHYEEILDMVFHADENLYDNVMGVD